MTSLPNSVEGRDALTHLHGYTNALTHGEVGPLIIGVKAFTFGIIPATNILKRWLACGAQHLVSASLV